ncbi:MAG: NAD(P)(+) transhydrogenase (Re/Si-specific) subunit beta [Bryobacterales bacterium]|nr:NAD(P)(+) transhydrogenase (Re/Si-specific) subunit beta [Bryobacterales bacterium]
MGANLINTAYLLAAVLFILGLKGLTSPRTAVRGNFLGAMGMLLAAVATLADRQIVSYEAIALGIAIGAVIGLIWAVRVQMTAMPQLVAAFNGFGGGASALVAGAAVFMPGAISGVPEIQVHVSGVLSAFIGSATLSGSLIAWAKLQGVLRWQPRGLAMQAVISGSALAGIALGVCYVVDPTALWAFGGLCALAVVYGVLLTVSVGGADMPVIIALLNSCSGLAAAATGFVLGNNVLIISGSLVGASGFILTQIMCKAMNRSLWDVLRGDLGEAAAKGATTDVYTGRIKSTSPEEAALIFDTARIVTVVPGYGMAVAQAQHAVRDFANLVESRGGEVRYAIHPVAGRMPGHMNVLLAEADVPYDRLYDMDTINPLFAETDVAIVLGANDVVNPAARDEPGSPIYGMPILDVDKAQVVLMIKRSLSPGFAGIPNLLFTRDNTLMMFADAKKAMQDLSREIRDL